MNYADLLRTYIKKSRLTLDEISLKLKQQGIAATKPYLSKLQNGKTPPASEKLNHALADITGGDTQKLQLAAFIEKAPEEIKDIVSLMDNSLIKATIQLEKKYPGFINGEYKNDSNIMESSEFQRFKTNLENVYGYTSDIFEYEKIDSKDNSFEGFNGVVPEIFYEAFLERAKIKISSKIINPFIIWDAIFDVVTALRLRLDQVLLKCIANNGIEEEAALKFLSGLPLKEKLDSALNMYLGFDITTEEFYQDLLTIIKLTNLHPTGSASTIITKSGAKEMISIVEKTIETINKKATEEGID